MLESDNYKLIASDFDFSDDDDPAMHKIHKLTEITGERVFVFRVDKNIPIRKLGKINCEITFSFRKPWTLFSDYTRRVAKVLIDKVWDIYFKN